MNEEQIEEILRKNIYAMTPDELDDYIEFDLDELLADIINDSESDDLTSAESEWLDDLYGRTTYKMSEAKELQNSPFTVARLIRYCHENGLSLETQINLFGDNKVNFNVSSGIIDFCD